MHNNSSISDTPASSQENLEGIRNLLLEKTADEIERELPGLIKTIRTKSIGTEETIHYIVGVSFTTSQTCLDYWVDRVVLPKHQSEYVIEPEKEPINKNHMYVIFYYPPDPNFNGEALRGALLANVEDRIYSNRFEEDQAEGSKSLKRFLEAFKSGYRTFRRELE